MRFPHVNHRVHGAHHGKFHAVLIRFFKIHDERRSVALPFRRSLPIPSLLTTVSPAVFASAEFRIPGDPGGDDPDAPLLRASLTLDVQGFRPLLRLNVQRTDSDFNFRRAFDCSRQPSLCEKFTLLSGCFLFVPWRSGGIGLRSGQFTCPVTLRIPLRSQGIWELPRHRAIGELSRPVWCVQVVKMGLGVSKTDTDRRYRNSGASINWRSRGSAGSRSGSSGLGGAPAEASVRSGSCHRPPTGTDAKRWRAALWCSRKIFTQCSVAFVRHRDRDWTTLHGF